MCNQTYPTVQMGNIALPKNKEVRYLGVHLYRRLIWAKHIKAKRNQLNLKVEKMYWLLGTRSTLSALKPLDLGHSAMGDSLKFQH
jgi:hypothetical protein